MSDKKSEGCEAADTPSIAQQRRHCIYDDLTNLLKGLKLATKNEGIWSENCAIEEEQMPNPVLHEDFATKFTVSSKLFCASCGIDFEDRNEQVVHFGSDWHRFNLKRKLSALGPVTREMFEEMADDLSSISGSDSTPDSDSDADRSLDSSHEQEVTSHRRPLVYFRNMNGDLLSMYRCLLADKKDYDVDLTMVAPRVGEGRYWTILMAGGGHFAGAIFDKWRLESLDLEWDWFMFEFLIKSQPINEQQTFLPAFRRVPNNNVQDLMLSWRDELHLCSRVFLRAPSYNKAMFFANKNPPFDKTDARIRMIPFPTRRPTMKEVKRVHTLLSTVTNYGATEMNESVKSLPMKVERTKLKQSRAPAEVPSKGQRQPSGEESESESESEVQYVMKEETLTTRHLKDFDMTRKLRNRKKKKPKAKPEIIENIVTAPPGVEQANLTDAEKKLLDDVYTACKTGNAKLLGTIIRRYYGNRDEVIANFQTNQSYDLALVSEQTLFGENEREGCHTEHVTLVKERLPDEILSLRFGAKRETILHVTSRADWAEMTYSLLVMGADPTLKDNVGLVPYSVCKSKSVRNAYRRFMAAYPDRYDYPLAQIPAPLTETMENVRKAKENERKKQAMKAKRKRQKEQKEREVIIEAETREKERFLKLSDREKRALAAERRLLDQVATSGGQKPVLSRCWQCGEDITGVVPFEYYDYKFCATKCLKQHRIKNAAGKL